VSNSLMFMTDAPIEVMAVACELIVGKLFAWLLQIDYD
jgi:hypothetical protein